MHNLQASSKSPKKSVKLRPFEDPRIEFLLPRKQDTAHFASTLKGPFREYPRVDPDTVPSYMKNNNLALPSNSPTASKKPVSSSRRRSSRRKDLPDKLFRASPNSGLKSVHHPIVIKKAQIQFSASAMADYTRTKDTNNSASASHKTSESVPEGFSKSESVDDERAVSPEQSPGFQKRRRLLSNRLKISSKVTESWKLHTINESNQVPNHGQQNSPWFSRNGAPSQAMSPKQFSSTFYQPSHPAENSAPVRMVSGNHLPSLRASLNFSALSPSSPIADEKVNPLKDEFIRLRRRVSKLAPLPAFSPAARNDRYQKDADLPELADPHPEAQSPASRLSISFYNSSAQRRKTLYPLPPTLVSTSLPSSPKWNRPGDKRQQRLQSMVSNLDKQLEKLDRAKSREKKARLVDQFRKEFKVDPLKPTFKLSAFEMERALAQRMSAARALQAARKIQRWYRYMKSRIYQAHKLKKFVKALLSIQRMVRRFVFRRRLWNSINQRRASVAPLIQRCTRGYLARHRIAKVVLLQRTAALQEHYERIDRIMKGSFQRMIRRAWLRYKKRQELKQLAIVHLLPVSEEDQESLRIPDPDTTRSRRAKRGNSKRRQLFSTRSRTLQQLEVPAGLKQKASPQQSTDASSALSQFARAAKQHGRQ